jgi:histidinol-phosphatase (PHP family)
MNTKLTADTQSGDRAESAALPPDYHTHTALCKHAKGDLAAYRHAAATRPLPEICFADHAPDPSGYDPGNRMELEQFPQYRDAVCRLQDDQPPTVLFGVEADYYTHCESFLRGWLRQYAFDLVIGSVHYIRDWGFDNPRERKRWATVDVKAVWREYFALIGQMVDTRLYDVIGHFDLPKKFGHRLADGDLKEYVAPLLDRVAGSGMAIEINTSGLRRPVAEIYPSPLILALAQERGIPICFGSDAHQPEDVGYAFAEVVALAKSVGYTHALRFRARQSTRAPLP